MSAADTFVGRTDELSSMRAELSLVRGGRPRLVWLSGEAGIGKTALVRRFADEARDATVLWASGDEGEAGLAYGVLAQLLTRVPARLRGGPRRSSVQPAADADPLRAGADLLADLGALQASGPVVLVVDDAHWADDPSARALMFVVRRLQSDQVLVVLTARPDVAAASGRAFQRALAQGHLVHRIALGGLASEDVLRLSLALGGPQLSPAAGRRLHDHTAGHPLYVRALLEELPPEALAAGTGTLPAPRSLGSLVLVRLAKLSGPAQDLVLSAAVLGHRSRLSNALALAEPPDPVAALDEAVRAGLLVETLDGAGHELSFPHLLVRAAVYADLAPARRHALHRRAAAVVEGAASLAHRVAAAVGPDEALARELQDLGEKEVELRSWHAAAGHLSAAAELSGTRDARATRLVAAAAAMLAGGDLAGASRVEPAVRAAPNSAGRSRILGQLAVFTGRLVEAREELSASLAISRGQADGEDGTGAGADDGRGVAAAHLGLVSLIEGRLPEAAELCSEALAADPPSSVAAIARFTLVLALVAQGRHEAALVAIDALRGNPDARLERSALRGVLALWRDDLDDAVTNFTESLRGPGPGPAMQGRILVLAQLAEAHYRLGDWDEALGHAELAISLAEDAEILLAAGMTHAVASYVSAGRGAFDEAAYRAAVAVAAAKILPWWASRAYAATAEATLAIARGDQAAALTALRAFDDPAVRSPVEGVGSLAWRALRTEAWLGTGDLPAAERELIALDQRAARRPPGFSALEAARLRGALAEARSDPAAARMAYERGLVLAGTVRAGLSRARLETQYGRLLLSLGERRPAVDLLRSAHQRLEELGAKPFLALTRELLRSAGLHPPLPGDSLELTSQEMAVVRLVVAGRTNQQAGDELFVTSRTVAFHLSNVYAKAGISSRHHLAERFPQLLP